MQLEESTVFTKKCFNGEPASCSFACPFSLDIRSFLEKVSKGRWTPAFKLLRNAVVFPTVVSALCDQPCRNHCQRTVVGDEPLAMCDLEEACITYVKSRKAELFVIPPKTQKIAVVGAGPAGLSCALNLAQKKYNITVFEKEDSWGGSLRQHPRFKDFEEDFKLQFSAVETEFRYNMEIKSLSELEGFDAVYVATGKGGTAFGLLDSWDKELLSTAEKKVFLGGELTGDTLMEAIARGNSASKIIESFIIAGKASKPSEPDRTKCERYLRHEGAEKKPLVPKADGTSYSEEEAKAEASRCLQCDCDYCEASCEMLKWFRKKPHKLALEVYTDANANPPMSTRVLTRETYSCNICGKCKSVCPESVDIGALLQYSRTDRKNAGKDVPALHDYWLREMDFHTGEGFFEAPPANIGSDAYAFFPGCQLGAAEPQHVLKAYDFLKDRFGAGILVGCCGAPAYWAGDRTRLENNFEKLKTSWEAMGKPTLVTACAYCGSMFEQFLPEIKRVSLYELLAQDPALTPARPFTSAAVFDPCAARDDAQMQQSVRALSLKAGVALSELKEPNRCCGYGGHMRLANPDLYDEITTHRAEASDQPYIVYCANCREVFRQKAKDCAHILDMVFGLEPQKRVPSLQSKKENTLEVKKQLMTTINKQTFIPETHEWDSLTLLISEELLEDMDRRLIVTDDLKEAIWLAERSGDVFVDEAGVRQCSMVKSVLTYWVQYKVVSPGTYEVLSAYIHRMRIVREV